MKEDQGKWTSSPANSVLETSTQLASMMMTQPHQDFGPYGNLAASHMARWLPVALAAVEDPEDYFRDLDARVTTAIRDRELSLMPSKMLQETNFSLYTTLSQTAHHEAEVQVLAEMVFLTPEPGAEPHEPPMDSSGAYVDPNWRPWRAIDEETDES